MCEAKNVCPVPSSFNVENTIFHTLVSFSNSLTLFFPFFVFCSSTVLFWANLKRVSTLSLIQEHTFGQSLSVDPVAKTGNWCVWSGLVVVACEDLLCSISELLFALARKLPLFSPPSLLPLLYLSFSLSSL